MYILSILGIIFLCTCCEYVTSSTDTRVKFFITSVNCAIDNRNTGGSSIRISGDEYSKKQDGLNIVVFDPQLLAVTSVSVFSNTNSREYSTHFNQIKPGSLIIITSQLLCSKDSSTDLKIQKSNLNGLNKFGFNIEGVTPLRLRSASYVFCKGKCSENITFSINLPFQALHDFSDDPVMISFDVYVQGDKDLLANIEPKSKSNSTILYTVITSCCILLLLSIALVLFLYYRKNYIQKKVLQKNHYTSCTSSMIDGIHQCKCQLIYCSMDDSNTRLQLTTSAKLFRRHDQLVNNLNRDDNENDGEDVNGVNEGGKTFATYVKVNCEEGEHCIYKCPSGVSKYDPPSRVPTLLRKPPPYGASCSTLTESYIMPHEYANPDGKSLDRYEVSTRQLDEGGCLDNTLKDLTEYTSLEPFQQEEYIVPHNGHQ